ncbi:MAG TPA: S8/S53 family peptidase, partial [Ilumatobacteraceae bacterium]|nr:S8/S53 family peptidase [Ilumatobacteraceae bacterium]
WSGAQANPMRANPMRANPMRANPMRANPMRANPMRANFGLLNSALPADPPLVGAGTLIGPGAHPKVFLLDSGLDGTAAASMAVTSFDLDTPDAPMGATVRDQYLDPVAGHGTFIAGLIEQRAPGCSIHAPKMLDLLGWVDESKVISQITNALSDYRSDAPIQRRQEVILNLSFGGPTLGEPEAMRSAIAAAINEGIVIVASAGNDSTCVPQYPAAFPGVIAVGALDSIGPAPFTNYGDWVDACAPGTDLVSTFFTFNGQFPTINTSDIDHFEGWATWSGTSFSAPIVVAAIAREMVLSDPPAGRASISAGEAANRVVRAPHLMRIPCLGTVVNL